MAASGDEGRKRGAQRPPGAGGGGRGGAGAPAGPETAWDRVAAWYDRLVGDEGSEHHRLVILPGVLRLLKASGAAPGARVLDLACGQGVLCRRLAREGYLVTGVDASPALLRAAVRRSRGVAPPIRYAAADVTRLLEADGRLTAGLEAGSFDAVTLVLAAQNLSPLSPVWEAGRAALKPWGRLIVVLLHPCFYVPRHSGWHWDPEAATQARLVGLYLTSHTVEVQVHPGLAARGLGSEVTPHFHRPLQAYVNTLGNAGLLVDHVEEWVSPKRSTAGAREQALDRARREIPLFLALRARKVVPWPP